ncbi:DNA/RNA nuclease SfsA [Clostridium cylindrosporum]|uniref:Sugar fermentation stimulation protein homolog n=1 Tax=Clostridium cylindrosporum DSM 605 TaxID=1121307 RepID=A0A0J8DAF2_CLOCY|nr:DNA/RNA nuclease SfsA [Clostridium cylindrosporum]KMT21304.1 sugar fermentation stimulation-like protein [Clostridium cylindrosporum DSM 605]
MAVEIGGEKINAIFLRRLNRFEAEVLVDDKIEIAHVANTGRMAEMLHTGVEVILQASNNPKRKTKYSLMFVNKKDKLICIKSALANNVFEDAFNNNKINWVSGTIKREVTYKNSRFDFLVEGEEKCFIEVKCGTYEEDGILKFPDAPTSRGRKHIGELINAKENGYKGAIVIIGFMDYITEFTPNYKIDERFGVMLKEALDIGIGVHVYRCSIKVDSIELSDEISYYF